jgi:hypothetical protein
MNNGKFQNLKEIDAYFNHEKIACLLCGEKFRGLYKHILKKHKMDVDNYRLQFGIPLTRGLIGNQTWKLCSDNGVTINKLHPELGENLRRYEEIARRHNHGVDFKNIPALQAQRVELGIAASKSIKHISNRTNKEITSCADCGCSLIKTQMQIITKKKMYCNKCKGIRQKVSQKNTPSYSDHERIKEYHRAYYHTRNGDYSFMNVYKNKYPNTLHQLQAGL